KLEKNRGVAALPPGEMAARCRVIFFVVPGTKEIAASLGGRDGVLAQARKGLVIYDLTTADPAASGRLARRAAQKGTAYLDAGMSGGATGAEAGTLTLMIGGDAKAFRRTRRFLAPIGRNIFYLGASGAGHTMKLIHNMVTHTAYLATCEAGQMARRAGIQLDDMIAVFNVSNARTYASEFRFPRHILSGKWDARSRVYNLEKDLRMAVEMGRRLKAETRLGEVTHAFLEKAIASGMSEKDYSLLYRDFEKIWKKRSARRKNP
ncbi:MAG: NAD(P)-dependent oxidoreductase, partial [bacterium]|nr:NAD(P)-dependent oxidoreductase [bacterium]